MSNDNMKKTVLDISNLKHNDIQHQELSQELIERIKAYKEILAEVEPSSLEKALDDFKRDRNPENEVRVWEKIALSYKHYCEAHPKSSFNDRKRAYARALQDSITSNPLIVS